MAEVENNVPDLDIDLEEIEKNINSKNKIEERLRDLSGKVKLTAQERDEIAKAKQELEDKNKSLAKEVEFYSSFSKTSSKYPNAGEHLDEIKAKVLAGYDPEDATISVLAKAGKLTAPRQEVDKSTALGGSAVNNPSSKGPKPLHEMSRDEKRAMLLDAESKGEISVS